MARMSRIIVFKALLKERRLNIHQKSKKAFKRLMRAFKKIFKIALEVFAVYRPDRDKEFIL